MSKFQKNRCSFWTFSKMMYTIEFALISVQYTLNEQFFSQLYNTVTFKKNNYLSLIIHYPFSLPFYFLLKIMMCVFCVIVQEFCILRLTFSFSNWIPLVFPAFHLTCLTCLLSLLFGISKPSSSHFIIFIASFYLFRSCGSLELVSRHTLANLVHLLMLLARY